MTDFRVDLGDGRTVKVAADTPEQAANAARMFLANEKGSQPQGRSDAAANAFGQGATMGFGDELAAGVRAAAPGFSNWMMSGPALQRDASIGGSPQPQTVSNAPDMGQRYDEELARQRAQTQADHKAYPAMTTGANIAGNVATTALALPAAATAAGPSLVGNIAKMAGTGAVLGGVQGFGEGAGGFDQRARSGLTSAMVGGAIGGALPVAGIAGRAAMESKPGRWLSENIVGPAAQKVAGFFEGTPARSLSAAAPDGTPGVTGPLTQFAQSVEDPARTGAIDRLATAFQRSGMSREQFDRKLAQLGPEAMLADLDPQFMSAARMANTMPGDTRTWAKNVLESRDRGAGNRLVGAFEGDQPPPSSYELNKAFTENARAVGRNAYQGDMVDAGLKQTPELMALYENPAVKGAIDNVMNAVQAAKVGRSGVAPTSPVEIMHMVKQEIQGLGFDKMTGRPTATQQQWRDLSTAFVDALKRANPQLAEADRAYAQAKSLPEFFESGRSFLRGGSTEAATDSSAPALADLLARADVQQVTATKAGATNAAREKALEGTTPARALARRIDESTPVRDKLMQIYGPQQAGKIMQQAGAEKTFAETSNDILRGSKTADKLAEVFDNAGVRITPGGVQPRLWERLADILSNLSGPNEAVRNQIGRMTLNPSQNADTLAAILANIEKRRGGRSLSAALAGSSGAQFGGP